MFFARHGFSVLQKGFAILRKSETKLWFG